MIEFNWQYFFNPFIKIFLVKSFVLCSIVLLIVYFVFKINKSNYSFFKFYKHHIIKLWIVTYIGNRLAPIILDLCARAGGCSLSDFIDVSSAFSFFIWLIGIVFTLLIMNVINVFFTFKKLLKKTYFQGRNMSAFILVTSILTAPWVYLFQFFYYFF